MLTDATGLIAVIVLMALVVAAVRRAVYATVSRSAVAAMNNLTDGVVFLSRTRGLMFCNDAAERALGLPHGSGPDDNYHRIADHPALAALRDDMLAGDDGDPLPPHEQAGAGGMLRIWHRRRITITVGRRPVRGLLLQDRSEIGQLRLLLDAARRQDAGTGLATTEVLHDHADRALEAAARLNLHVAMLLIQIDQIDEVFEQAGWSAVSDLLTEAAARLQGSVRAMDTIARVGPGNLAVLVTHLPGEDAIDEVADRFRQLLCFPFAASPAGATDDPAPRVHQITGSIGVAFRDGRARTSHVMLQNAAVAAGRAHGQGGDLVMRFQGDHDQEERDAQLALMMRRGLDASEFTVLYQPIVRMSDRRAVGFEALVRWQSDGRAISPADFIPVAERTGLIHQLGDYVLRTACRDAGCWRYTLDVSVNVSVVELLQGDTPRRVLAALSFGGLAPERLKLELTETSWTTDMGVLRSAVDEIRSLGVGVSLDDFGTGHSTLSYLQGLQFDCLKIDGRFVRDLENPRTLAMVKLLLSYCAGIGVTVVAECVETEEQRSTLLALGCHHGQGFLFGRAMPHQAILDAV